MKRILVPTDFSANSKAGILYAVQLASQSNAWLEFIYTYNLMRPFNWSDVHFERYRMIQKQVYWEALKRFIDDVFASTPIKVGLHSCVVEEGILPDVTIMQYCQNHQKIDYICMSTRGAGKLDKLLGTNTGNLITKSETPVIVVPRNYSIGPIRHLLYATDLKSYEMELKKVLTVACPLAAEVEVLHISCSDSVTPAEEVIVSVFKKYFNYELKLHVKKKYAKHSFVENLRCQLNSIRPAMVIMFVDQNRPFIQRLFQPSNTENLSFDLQIPLLAFKKGQKASKEIKYSFKNELMHNKEYTWLG